MSDDARFKALVRVVVLLLVLGAAISITAISVGVDGILVSGACGAMSGGVVALLSYGRRHKHP